MDEWSLIEKKIPSLRSDLRGGPGPTSASRRPSLSAEQQRLLPLLDGTRDVQQLIEECGLVEFEVGKALFGLITAGFAHRVGTSAASAPRRSTTAGSTSTATSASPSTRPAMLDEALREFRRVADLRPADASAPFFLGLIALRQARWDEAVAAFRQAIEKGGPRAAALHNLGLALERLGRLDEADTAYGDAAGRARDDARVMLGWGVVALKRGEYQVAQGRLARARELAGAKPLPPLWYWAATLASAGLDDADGALKAARRRRRGAPGKRRAAEQPRRAAASSAATSAGAETMLRAALAEDPSLPQISKNLADILYRNGRYDEARGGLRARRQARPRSGRRPLLQAGQHRLSSGGTTTARGRAGAGPPSSIRATSWPRPTSTCWASP